MATRLARLDPWLEAPASASSDLSPSSRLGASEREFVSLRTIKSLVQSLSPSHPLRILVLGEPDEIPCGEYATKVVGWFRLLASWED